MAPTKPFDLRLEVDTYVNRLDNNLLLSSEESDELRDHFHCQVEELVELGLSETEAFQVSKMRFGEQALIQKEYHKAKPMKMMYRYIMVGLLLLFGLRFINTLVTYSSAVMFVLMSKWEVPFKTASAIDLGLKASLILLLAASIFSGLKKGKISRGLIWTLPFLSVLGDISLQFVHWQALLYNKHLYTSLIGTAVLNSRIIMLISYLILVGLFFVLWHRNGRGLRLSN